MKTRQKLVALAAFFVGAIVLPSCDDAIKTEGVAGVVTYNGAPLAEATVHFVPTDASGSASYGTTNEKGEYKLQTLLGAADAGTTPGKYKVFVTCTEAFDSDETYVDVDGEEKTMTEVESIIPKRYTDENTSGFEANVVKGSNEFNFDLVD